MKTTVITPDLIQLTRLGFVNAYLVREPDGFTLIDTTLGNGAARDLIGAAEAAGGEIRRIALTHGHGDHAGGLDAIKKQLGDSVEVYLGEPDARFLAGEKVVEGKMPGFWRDVKTVPDVRLSGGERIGSLQAKIFGGAEVLPFGARGDTVGNQNVRIAFESLRRHCIPILTRCTGGHSGILIRLYSETGDVAVRSVAATHLNDGVPSST